MNSIKNPILNFRITHQGPATPLELKYDLITGQHSISDGLYRANAFVKDAMTMVTLTREAADSSENSG